MSDPFGDPERRRYLRLQDNFRVELEPWGGAPQPNPGEPAESKPESWVAFSRDLSVGGVAVVSESGPPSGSVVEARIHVAELDEPLVVVGEVVRSTPLGDGRYESALRFAPGWIDEDVRARLEQLVYGA